MTKCLGVVLAGGLSSRMGQDKSSLTRNQISMLEFSKQLLTDCLVNDIVVSGNKHQVNDMITNAGPLGGIYSVIEQLKPEAMLILPIDLPLMTANALKKLKTVGELSHKACFYQDNFLPLYLPNNSFTELFFAKAFTNFSGKGPSIKHFLKQIPHQTINSADEQTLFNSNTPQEWQFAQSIFTKKRSSYV